MRKLYYYAKTISALAVASAVLWMAYSVHTVSRTLNVQLAETASAIHTTLGHADTVLTGLSQTISTVNKTVGTLNDTIAETRQMITVQKDFQEAQNKRFLDIMEQGEQALINANSLMYDIGVNQGRITDATIAAVNKLVPVLENSAKAAEEASRTISDPKLKETMVNLAETSRQASVAMTNIATTTGRLDKKAEEVLKPANFIKTLVMKGGLWITDMWANIKAIRE